MNDVGIAGLGWVTPLGTSLEEVWAQVRAGVVPETKTLTNPETGRVHSYFATPPGAVAHLARNPRLRRASAISQLAVAAGLAALENAGLAMTPEIAARTAVVFAICDGGVLYTRRFYEQIAKQGANTASPLLFPETVYNAPASHLAALLGIDGASYTLVGDASVGMSALHFAAELLETSDVGQVVVVGAEECDWILCEAYAAWRLARTPLAEGAAALVLRREGRWRLHTHPGAPFFRRRDAAAALSRVLAASSGCGAPAADRFGGGSPIDQPPLFPTASSALAADPRGEAPREQSAAGAPQPRLAIVSANGTFIDRAEAAALAAHFPDVPTFSLKKSFGECPGAGALMQTVAAALSGGRALVTVVGFNQQAGAAVVSG